MRTTLRRDGMTSKQRLAAANRTVTRRTARDAQTRRQHETRRRDANAQRPRTRRTDETPKQDARRDATTATTDIPQLVQTGVEQAGAATALLSTTAIPATPRHGIIPRPRNRHRLPATHIEYRDGRRDGNRRNATTHSPTARHDREGNERETAKTGRSGVRGE